MPVLAVIPARLGATRLPRKPLRLLGGVPLIVRVFERVRALGVADAVVVASDHPEVHAAVAKCGGISVDTHHHHPSGTDRVAEVAARPEYADFDIVLNVQGDEPFVSAEALRGAIGMCARFPLGTTAIRADAVILQNPSVVKVVCDDSGRAMYFSRAPVPWLREASDETLHHDLILQHVGTYAYRRAALRRWVSLPVHPLEQVERLEQLRPLAAGIAMGVALLDGPLAGGIDTEDDLASANARWRDPHLGQS